MPASERDSCVTLLVTELGYTCQNYLSGDFLHVHRAHTLQNADNHLDLDKEQI